MSCTGGQRLFKKEEVPSVCTWERGYEKKISRHNPISDMGCDDSDVLGSCFVI
jgi:hypothetical protein